MSKKSYIHAKYVILWFQIMSSSKHADRTARALWSDFAEQTSTHGLRRILETERPLGKLIWVLIFLSALAACSYHCSFLILKYLDFGKVTTAEEIHAKQLRFPALTVCNMNILKKAFFTEQLSKNANSTYARDKGM